MLAWLDMVLRVLVNHMEPVVFLGRLSRRLSQHLILIGDHRQLKPLVQCYELSRTYNFSVSMFERFVRGGMRYATLTEQHRMRPEFAELLTPSVYERLTSHASVHANKVAQVDSLSRCRV